MGDQGELVMVLASFDASELMLVRTVLLEAGIPVVETGMIDSLTVGMGTQFMPRQPVRLQVRRADVARATALLAAYRQEVAAGHLALPDEGTPPETERAVDAARAARRTREIIVQVVFILIALTLITLFFWPGR